MLGDPPAAAARLLRAAAVATAVTAPLAWLDGTLFAWHPAYQHKYATGCVGSSLRQRREREEGMERGPPPTAPSF